MSKVKVLHILGIDDSNKVEVLFLSPNQNNVRVNFKGNVHILPFIDNTHIDVHRITVGGMKGESFKVSKVDLVFNAICNPDTNQKSLKIALNIVNALRVPVFNHPEYIMKTGRENIYELFKRFNGVVVPKTIRAQPKCISDIIKIIDSREIRFPFLFREGGYHAGQNLELVQNLEGIHTLEKFAFDGRDYYLTDFIDFKSQDGLYRKYRVIVIGGNPYPRHLIISDLWNVHAESRKRLMDNNPECRLEEEKFLKEFALRDHTIFRKIYEELKLEFLGVDFSFDSNGSLIIFEINSCFRAVVDGENQETKDKDSDYHKPYVDNLKKAVENLILEKAGHVRNL